MISAGDFSKKQIVFVFFNRGEKLSFSNDNMVIREADGHIKFQITCYRLFLVFGVGHGSITTGLIQRSKRFGFSILLLNQNLKPYQRIGFALEGNTLLRRAQYEYASLDLARHITANKLRNQRRLLMDIRNRNEVQAEAAARLAEYAEQVASAPSLQSLMGIEGTAARVFFPAYFNTMVWHGRAPRIKSDIPNVLLDIGYTILFSFVESVLDCYGFDLYCGVMHCNFYMRKSLVCDMVEPFRCIVDHQLRKAYSLGQVHECDFHAENGRYMLKWEKNAEYVSWLAKPVMDRKEEIHAYIQAYYRAFMKHKPAEAFPTFEF